MRDSRASLTCSTPVDSLVVWVSLFRQFQARGLEWLLGVLSSGSWVWCCLESEAEALKGEPRLPKLTNTKSLLADPNRFFSSLVFDAVGTALYQLAVR